MKFEIFKIILLSCGICECNFYLRSSKKEGFIGYSTEKNTKKYCITFYGIINYFDDSMDILNAKLINDKTLKEVWDDLEIYFIDGFDEKEYLRYILTPNFYLNEYVAINKESNTLDVKSLIKKLKISEYNGDVMLYAGNKELSEFSENDITFSYYIYDTYNKYIYLLKKDNSNQIKFEYIVHWYQRKKINTANLSIGRKYDKFSLKSGINKSERYNLMLKIHKNQNQDIIGIILGCLDVIAFFFILISIALKSIYSKLWIYSVISFVLLMFFTFFFSSIHNKKWKKLNAELFPEKDLKIKFTDMFLQIKKESDDNCFHKLHEALMQINKKIKMSGGFYEEGAIDLNFYTKEHDFSIFFYNQFVLINIDEESKDLNIKLKYIDFKNYAELESKIYSTIIEYL